MKRDMDLIRQILLAVESKEIFDESFISLPDLKAKPNLKNCTENELYYHIMLSEQAGLLTAINFSSHDGSKYLPKELTWFGHEFLDAARDNNRWKEAKKLAEKAGGVTVDILTRVLTELAKQSVMGLIIPK